MMRQVGLLLALVLLVGTAHSQDAFTAMPVSDLDAANGWVSGIRPEGLVMHTLITEGGLYSDEGLPPKEDFETAVFFRGDTWNAYDLNRERLSMARRDDHAVGTLSSAGDTTVVFSLDRPHPDYPAGSLILARYNRELLDQMELVLPAKEDERHIHPAISADGQQIVFASNRKGGAGGFDLYYVNRLPAGWSDPITLGSMVNTPGSEVFPTWQGDRVCFSSDGHPGMGGLDLYHVTRGSQWQEVNAFPTPFNSRADDFVLLWLSEDDAFINSNREGNDRVYRLSRERKNPLAKGLTAELICAGTPVQGVRVRITNELGELVLENTTGEDGRFDVGTLELRRTYRAQFDGAPAAVLDKSLLYIVNSEGKRIMVFAPNRNGLFVFELMPFSDDDGLALLENPDASSLLSVSIEGQVYEQTPGDIGSGELIYVEGPDGSLTALSYTADGGAFRFDDLSPEMQYTFRFDEDRQAMKMVIYDRGEEVVLDVVDGKVSYERVKADEALRINNEKGEAIAIRKDDLFVIRNIYYAFNSAELNLEARQELDRLVAILKSNPALKVELGSHTDSRGTNEFNRELSERRAQGCVSYLQTRGITRQRMISKGYGETRLLNNCTDEVECDEEAHAANRRTEVRLYE